MNNTTPVKLELINGESVNGYINLEQAEKFDNQKVINLIMNIYQGEEEFKMQTISIPAEVILSADIYLK